MIEVENHLLGLAAGIVVLCYLIYLYQVEKQVEVHCSDSARNSFILKKINKILNSYQPTVLIPTLLKLVLSVRKIKCLKHFDRQMIDLPDGERISLDWYPKNARRKDEKTPVIILVPGITSDSRAVYANIFAKYAVTDYNFRVAIVNRRGYCGMPYLKEEIDPVTWNKFEDLDEVIKSVREVAPRANLYLAGCSMGANFIQKYAGLRGQLGSKLDIKGMGCISSPYCLKITTGALNSGTLLKRAMAETLKDTFKNHLHDQRFRETLKQKNIDVKRVLSSRCSDEFNSSFSIHFTNYKDLDGYKEAVSSKGVIRHIEIPTLAVNVKTDPISPYTAIPFDEIEDNPNYIQVVANGGGHLEYFSGLKLRRWSYDLILSYFRCLEHDSRTND